MEQAGLAFAVDAVRRRVPVVMRGGAPLLLGDAHAALSSVESIGAHLSDTEVSVLHAPPNAGRVLHEGLERGSLKRDSNPRAALC